jgi:hypothetical protein
MPDDIVESIDHALHDYALSNDAMRWAPDIDADLEDDAYASWRQRVLAGMLTHGEAHTVIGTALTDAQAGEPVTFVLHDEIHVFDVTAPMQAIANGTARRPFDRYSLSRNGRLPGFITITNAGD